MALTNKQEIFCQEFKNWIINGFNIDSRKIYGTKYYVYCLINPINNKPFYVGKGKGKRAESHLMEHFVVYSTTSYNTNKHKVINEILSVGLKPIIHVIQNTLEEFVALRIERELIKRNKEYLTNGANGCLSKAEKNLIHAKQRMRKLKPLCKIIKEGRDVKLYLYIHGLTTNVIKEEKDFYTSKKLKYRDAALLSYF